MLLAAIVKMVPNSTKFSAKCRVMALYIFQVMIACDDDYKDSDKTRCALVFVYDMLDYIQNSEGEFLHAGVNAPGNSKSLILSRQTKFLTALGCSN